MMAMRKTKRIIKGRSLLYLVLAHVSQVVLYNIFVRLFAGIGGCIYLRAERGGGGVLTRPQDMIAIAIAEYRTNRESRELWQQVCTRGWRTRSGRRRGKRRVCELEVCLCFYIQLCACCCLLPAPKGGCADISRTEPRVAVPIGEKAACRLCERPPARFRPHNIYQTRPGSSTTIN